MFGVCAELLGAYSFCIPEADLLKEVAELKRCSLSSSSVQISAVKQAGRPAV